MMNQVEALTERARTRREFSLDAALAVLGGCVIAGGADLTPLCGITMSAVATDITPGRIAATYTGTTTCEGPIAGGTLVVVQ